MKKVAIILLLVVMGGLMFNNLYTMNDETNLFNGFGQVTLSERVSDKMVHKNVKGSEEEVIFGKSNELESGSANMVTSIVVNYRSFDTLGEVTVLFISALGIALALGGTKTRKISLLAPNYILKHGTRMIFGLVMIVGVYIFVHGHLTPGGGFPGGSMLASAVLLMYIADESFRLKIQCIKATEGIAGSLYVVGGLLGLLMGGYFLYNFLPNGTIGHLFSSGLIPVIYILIGLKVGAELSTIVTNFFREEVEN